MQGLFVKLLDLKQVLAVETALVRTMSVCYHSILCRLVSTSLR